MTFRGTQAPLPPAGGEDFESVQESIKVEKNSKGYNYSFRLNRLPGETLTEWADRTVDLNNLLWNRYGG